MEPKFKVGDILRAKCDGIWRVDYIKDGRYLVTDIVSWLTGNIPIEEQDVWHAEDPKKVELVIAIMKSDPTGRDDDEWCKVRGLGEYISVSSTDRWIWYSEKLWALSIEELTEVFNHTSPVQPFTMPKPSDDRYEGFSAGCENPE